MLTRLSLLVSLVAATTVACSRVEGTSADAAVADALAGASNPAPRGVGLGFRAPNLPASLSTSSGVDVELTGSGCTIDTDTGRIGCLSDGNPQPRFEIVDQGDPDGTRIGAFLAASWSIPAGTSVVVTGAHPLALVSEGDVRINGSVVTGLDGPNGGGFAGGVHGEIGTGPGAGAAIIAQQGAGGAGFCGKGGNGGVPASAGIGGGRSYGAPELHPLWGGSGGGGSGMGGGRGGGAIMIVSGGTISIGATGALSLPGGRAAWGAGGGSGGAVLLAARSVRVAGVVAANGGGGGAFSTQDSSLSEPGQPSDRPALGGTADNGNAGGSGAAGTMIDGARGTYQMGAGGLGDAGGGGGGGAGWIRIDTLTGTAEITGTLSPPLGTMCATVGKLTGG